LTVPGLAGRGLSHTGCYVIFFTDQYYHYYYFVGQYWRMCGCNGTSFGDHGVLDRDCIPSL